MRLEKIENFKFQEVKGSKNKASLKQIKSLKIMELLIYTDDGNMYVKK